MSTEIILPKLGFSMNEGAIAEWFVADGSQVTAGEKLYGLESEQSVEEIAAPASGTLRIKVASGESMHPVGTVVGVIEYFFAATR